MSEQLYTHDYQPQRELVEQLLQPQPTVIGLEGGPCSGKTTLMGEVEYQASRLARRVALVPEAATQHIERLQAEGRDVLELAANNRPAYLQFQKDVMRTIVQNITAARERHAGSDAVIVIDRPDIGAYVTAAEHREVYGSAGLAKPPIHALVDKLIFLPSVACENPELYAALRLGNGARVETSAAEAAEVSDRNLRAIAAHPELQVAWGGNFGDKIRRLAATVLRPEIEGEIKFTTPEPVPFFLRDDLAYLDIQQSYHQLGGHEFRLRQTKDSWINNVTYHFAVKTGEGALRHELQRRLTQEEYLLLDTVPRIGKTLEKQRTMALDRHTGDSAGKRRLWSIDRYRWPKLDGLHLETEVDSQEEYDALATKYAPFADVSTESARTLVHL